jgi:hypothetical protein
MRRIAAGERNETSTIGQRRRSPIIREKITRKSAVEGKKPAQGSKRA